MNLYYKVNEAAKLLGLSIPTMYVLFKTKGFPVLKIPTRSRVTYRIPKDALEEWIKQNSN